MQFSLKLQNILHPTARLEHAATEASFQYRLASSQKDKLGRVFSVQTVGALMHTVYGHIHYIRTFRI